MLAQSGGLTMPNNYWPPRPTEADRQWAELARRKEVEQWEAKVVSVLAAVGCIVLMAVLVRSLL